MRQDIRTFTALGLTFPGGGQAARHSNEKFLTAWIFTIVGCLLGERVQHDMRSTDHARRAQQPPRSVRAALCTWIPRVGMSVLPHCRRLSGSATTLVFFGALNGLQRAISSTFRSPRVASASSTTFSLPGWTQKVDRLLARRHSGSRHESWERRVAAAVRETARLLGA